MIKLEVAIEAVRDALEFHTEEHGIERSHNVIGRVIVPVEKSNMIYLAVTKECEKCEKCVECKDCEDSLEKVFKITIEEVTKAD
jgi:hypothetical protein